MDFATKENLILDPRRVAQKVSRMAHEVYEHNVDEAEIVFAGIEDTGYSLAVALRDAFVEVTDTPARLVRVSLDKRAPTQSDVTLDCPPESLEGKAVVIVDDVLNTGRTLAYALRPFLQIAVGKLQVAVLVDRNYHSFPVLAQYVGYPLSTTVNEHVHVVEAEGGGFAVYLD